MTLTIELTPEQEARLRAEAEREGKALSDVVSALLDNWPAEWDAQLQTEFQEAIRPKPPLTDAEMDAFLAEFTEGSEESRVLKADLTRADYYEDADGC